MKTKLFQIVVLIGLALSAQSFINKNNYTPQKHALVIAIGDYGNEDEWANIGSTNDYELIKNALSIQNFTDIRTIYNKNADKAGIIKAINELIARSHDSDIVVIHISSHGQQIFDFSGDELDGLDEAIVPYGAPPYTGKNKYKGEKHLSDDELSVLLNKLRLKLGKHGDLLVTVDACFSGTISRGQDQLSPNQKIRGNKPPIIPKGKKVIKKGQDLSSIEIKPYKNKKASIAPMVIISGSQAGEKNYQFGAYGSLSIALSNALKDANSNTTYRSLFASITTEMSKIAKNQTPDAEGVMDRKLFGGKVAKQERYYTIRSMTENRIYLDGGTLTYLHPGTKIEIYPAGTLTRDTLKRISSGEVKFASENAAQVLADKNLGDAFSNPSELWAFVSIQTFGTAELKLKVLSNNENEKLEFEEKLSKIPFLTIENDSPDIILRKIRSSIKLNNASNGVLIDSIVYSSDYYASVYRMLESRMRSQIMQKIEFRDPMMNLKISFLPAKYGVVDTSKTSVIAFNKKYKNGMYHLKTTDTFFIKVENVGKKSAYLNVMDIMTDGNLNILFPDYAENQKPSEYVVGVGKAAILPRPIILYEPYGVEFFKFFATSEPVNMLFVSTNRGGTPEMKHPVEKIFAKTFNISSRSNTIGDAPYSDAGTTITIPFKIIK